MMVGLAVIVGRLIKARGAKYLQAPTPSHLNAASPDVYT